MLYIDLLLLIAGKSRIDLRQYSCLYPVLDLRLVKEIRGEVLVAEEEPVLSAGACSIPFSQEATEGGDASAGADHDDVLVMGRQLELRIPVNIEFKGMIGAELRQAVGAEAVLGLAVDDEGVLSDCDVDLSAVRFG